MTPALADLTRALDFRIRREVELAPAEYKANAETLAALEQADVRERLWTAEDDAEREQLCKDWLRR